MFMRNYLIVISALITVISGLEKPCCASKKFFGQLKVVTGSVKNGHPSAIENTFQMDYSRDAHIERLVGYMYDDTDKTTQYYTVYNDYKTGRRYGLYGKNSTTCVVTIIDKDSQAVNCVPSELRHEGTITVGSGNTSIQANVWSGYADNMHWRMQTSSRDCTPISLTRYGFDSHGYPVMESTTYLNMTQYRLSVPDALELPSQCKFGGTIIGK
ncbi:uncharacterized protein LOC132733613 isoform X4 [Ruditapes philippinarum]|uniref:uncharacterized protein LOC132733613 isoform X4 n=1 Tax=Ruditapes philippinarum TaxID=129788 RepID=UPI00295ADC87|nr:uncharacterized protein LOC132733613 isoform X4 [Ruditapes philippinarum]